MSRSMHSAAVSLLGLVAIASAAWPGHAAEVPDITRKMVADLKLDQSLIAGLDEELKIPNAWIAGARKEGGFRLTGSWDPGQVRAMTEAFVARYPFIKVNYSRGSFTERAQRPLIAFQGGRYIADVVSGIGGALSKYLESNALHDLSDVPNVVRLQPGMKHDKNMWTGIRIRYWCMSYNTEKVQKSELPATWDDILTNPRWRDGKLAVNNLPQVWLLPLWGEKGEAWGKDFLTRLFNEVRPQLRKEGANALLSLVVAGEFDAAIPAGDHRIMFYKDKGAPIGWHCPQPVPSAISEMGILRGSPNINSARIFANWLLSKEGQIAQYHSDKSPPLHKDLQLPAFLPFPEQIVGRPIAFRDPGLEEEHDKVLQIWNPLWEKMR